MIVRKEEMEIETASGVRHVSLYTTDGRVTSVCVDMGMADLRASAVPVLLPGDTVINRGVTIAGQSYEITCVSMGNPHCVVFVDRVDDVALETIGPAFEHNAIFPERVNTEFVRVVNETTLRLRVWERGNGETLACGTGACAAAVAAIENGYCRKNADIIVKLPGGDLIVNVTDSGVTLTGNARMVYEGTVEI